MTLVRVILTHSQMIYQCLNRFENRENLEKIGEMCHNHNMGSILLRNRNTGGKFLVLVVTMIYSLVNLMMPVMALSQEKMQAASLDGSIYYDPEENDCTVSRPTGNDVTWIGDSYSVGAEYQDKLITKKLPGVDLGKYDDTANPPADAYIKGSKFFSDGKDSGDSDNPTGLALLEKITAKNELRPYLVFALGTNGGVEEKYIEKLINLAGANTKIILTTIYTAARDYNSTNEVIKKAAEKYNNISVADWAAVAKSEYYKDDSSGVHPFGHYDEWVDLIYEALPQVGNSGSSSTSITVADNKLYNGEPVIAESLMEKVKENQPFYEEAAKKHGFPWQIIAVLHINETGATRYNPSNGQGVYQLYSYTDGGTNSNAFPAAESISDAEFARQTEIVADLIETSYGKGLDLNTEGGVKRFFFQYNGTAQVYIAQARDLGFTEEEANWGEGSPYVMNMADEKRDPTKNSNWKQIIYDGGSAVNHPANTSAGAYLMYAVLGGVTSMCAVGGNGNINDTALTLSWPERGHDPWNDVKPEYKTALAETGVNQLGDSCSMNGNSCDAFVTTVLRYSGVDKDFPCCGVSTQYAYLSSHPELYEEIPNIGSAENMQPGDIRINPSQHIEMYVVLKDGTGAIASASHCDRTSDHGIPYYADSGYLIYRKR